MGAYLVQRGLHAVLVVIGVSLVIFVLSRLSGDPVSLMVPFDVPREQREAIRRDLGLDQPLPIQYLDALGQDYVRTARAKGLGEWVVVGLHALKNAAIPVVTALGVYVGQLLSGAVITEQIFAYPGIGRLAIDAVSTRDFPVVQANVI